jgi:ABC-type sugar transport system permease subunit
MAIVTAPASPNNVDTQQTSARRLNIKWIMVAHIVAALLIFILALFLRLRAADNLSTDFDEDDYLRAGQLYAQHLSRGDLAGVINERENYEHPPLSKLVYGVVLLAQPNPDYANPTIAYPDGKNGGPEIAYRAKPIRDFNAWVGAFTAGIVAVVSPPAGFIVAVNSWHIKYTSQAMLEALPCLFAALMLLFLMRSRRNGDIWFWLAAVALGLTASGKYLYAVGGFAALGWLLWRGRDKRSWKLLLAWSGVALLTFYVANPALWLNPVGRLYESLAFSANYSRSQHVQNSGFGMLQPAIWLFTSVPLEWLPRRAPDLMPVRLEAIFSLLALVAFPAAWRNPNRIGRLVALFFAINMLFLFFWQTKWPQYILAVTVPVALLAGWWLTDWTTKIWHKWQNWRAKRTFSGRKLRETGIWLLPISLFFAAVVLYPLVVQFALATTYFQSVNIRDGSPPLVAAFGRGLVGLPSETPGMLPYGGSGNLFGMFMWPGFLPTLRFNVLWVIVSMSLATALGLWLATLLSRPGLVGKAFWRTLFILPWAIPEFVGALIWGTLFDDVTGSVNYVLPADISWLTEVKPVVDIVGWLKPLTNWLNGGWLSPFGAIVSFIAETLSFTPAVVVMVVIGVWVAFPFMLVISLVALQNVGAEIKDAAEVDGAHGWSLWRNITYPLIAPAVLAGVMLRGVLLFNAFHLPLMVGTDAGRSGTQTFALAGYGTLNSGNNYTIAALLNMLAMACAWGVIWLFNRRTRVVEGVDYV